MMIKKYDPFYIAEAGINHNGDLKTALKLVDSAKRSGASAIKFQTYKTEKRVKKNSPVFDILKKCELKLKDFKIINDYCKKKKIIFFSTPFDTKAVEFLNNLNVPFFKIASFDIENYNLINSIVKTKKPIIYSTGMSSLTSIEKLYKILKKKNISQNILHCISSYPNKEENSYLANINYLKNKFDCNIGLSDHSAGIKVPIYSYLLGAKIIEKHFKLKNDNRCVDSPVSIDEIKFKNMINEINNTKKILGKFKFGIRSEEKGATIFIRKKKS